MSQERSEALVIRAVDFSETSRIVTVLCPRRGKLALMASGVKRPKSQLASLLDTFNRLEIVYYWKDGRGVQKLGEAVLIDGYAGLKKNLEKNVYAGFPLEFAYKVAQENEPSGSLYATLVRGFESLANWSGSARVHATWQIIRLLDVAGFAPDLGAGSTRSAQFANDHGIVTVGERGGKTVRSQDVRTLRAMAASQAECPGVEDDGNAFALISAYVSHQLDTEFRSLRVIDQMFGRPRT